MNFAGYELNGRLRWGVVRDGRITLAPLAETGPQASTRWWHWGWTRR